MAETTMAEATPAEIVTVETIAPDFRIGYVLGKSFSVYFRNIIPFSLLALLVTSPQLFLALQAVTSAPLLDLSRNTHDALSTLLLSTLPYVATAMLVFGTVQELRGQRASFGVCFVRGTKLLFPVLGVILSVSLATGFGLILLIIPGLVLMTMLWVAIPVAVVERKGIFDSLERSRELTRGYRWQIFAVIVLVFVLSIVVGLPIATGVAILNDLSSTSQTGTLDAVGEYAFQTFLFVFWGVTTGVGYFTLRTVKEGIDIEEIARVFD